MFIFHKDTTLEDLGNGVTRRILAHDGKNNGRRGEFCRRRRRPAA